MKMIYRRRLGMGGPAGAMTVSTNFKDPGVLAKAAQFAPTVMTKVTAPTATTKTNFSKVQNAVVATPGQGFMTQSQAAAPIVTAMDKTVFSTVMKKPSYSDPEVFTPAKPTSYANLLPAEYSWAVPAATPAPGVKTGKGVYSDSVPSLQTQVMVNAQPALWKSMTPAVKTGTNQEVFTPAPVLDAMPVKTWREAVPAATDAAARARSARPKRGGGGQGPVIDMVPAGKSPAYVPQTVLYVPTPAAQAQPGGGGGGGGGGGQEEEEEPLVPIMVPAPDKKKIPWWLIILGGWAVYEYGFKKTKKKKG